MAWKLYSATGSRREVVQKSITLGGCDGPPAYGYGKGTAR